MKIIKISLLILLATCSMISCSKKDDPGGTSTQKMSGEFFTRWYDTAAPSTPLTSYDKTLTYNTAANDGKQLWVDDHGWAFKSKFNIDYANLLFRGMDSAYNTLLPAKPWIRVIAGKIIPGGGRSKSGVKVDSIYLKMEFTAEDPGNIYELKGHARTGFFEDEY